jgi:hypothetical protein
MENFEKHYPDLFVKYFNKVLKYQINKKLAEEKKLADSKYKILKWMFNKNGFLRKHVAFK